MRERPILFSAPMVNAILAGTKSQTRRIAEARHGCISIPCPYGVPGDRLYVREAWRSSKGLDSLSGSAIAEKCAEAGYREPWAPIHYEADGERRDWLPFFDGQGIELGRYRHARFMPRWAARILLEVTEVRVQRLREIDEADALAEGVDPYECTSGPATPDAVSSFAELWDRINGKRAPWASNPWVWAVSFKRIEVA